LTLPMKALETSTPYDNTTLVNMALSGGPQAFGPIIERYKDAVFGVALSRLRNFHDAEDLTQSSFVEAFDRLADLKDPNRLGAWLRSITIHGCINYLKREARSVNIDSIAEPESSLNPHSDLEQAELREQVLTAIGRLSKTQRETVTLYYISGYSQQEVAHIQEVPVGTIKRRLHEARNRLKEDMIDMVEDVLKNSAPDESFTEKVFDMLNAYPNHINLFQKNITQEIKKIGSPGIPGFQKALAQNHWQTRRAAVGYMRTLPPTEDVIDMLKQSLNDTNKKVRRFAITQLLKLDVSEQRKREEFMPLICELMLDSSKTVRKIFTMMWPIKRYVSDIPPEKVAQALELETVPKLQQGFQRLLLAILRHRREQNTN
jgi:RNA polymerase sigma-70 factor, ECF subfamily